MLKSTDTSDVDLAWRLCRAHHDLAEETLQDPSRREQLLRDGLALAETTLQSHPDSGPVLKWYGILLGRLGDFLPTKEKVAKLVTHDLNCLRVRASIGEGIPVGD